MTSYLIEPIDMIIKYKINHIQINISNLELDIKAGITTYFYDETQVVRRQEFFILDGEDYKNWKSDDYIISYICNKYNLTLQK